MDERERLAAAIEAADGNLPFGYCEWLADGILRAGVSPSTGEDRPWVRTSDTHPQAVDIAAILDALAVRKPASRLRGLWVQWHGCGDERARKGEVVVSVQYDHGYSDPAYAEEGRGANPRDASRALAAALTPTGDTPKEPT